MSYLEFSVFITETKDAQRWIKTTWSILHCSNWLSRLDIHQIVWQVWNLPNTRFVWSLWNWILWVWTPLISHGQRAAFLPQRPWGQYFAAFLRPSVWKVLPSWRFGIFLSFAKKLPIQTCQITWNNLPNIWKQQITFSWLSNKVSILVRALLVKLSQNFRA